MALSSARRGQPFLPVLWFGGAPPTDDEWRQQGSASYDDYGSDGAEETRGASLASRSHSATSSGGEPETPRVSGGDAYTSAVQPGSGMAAAMTGGRRLLRDNDPAEAAVRKMAGSAEDAQLTHLEYYPMLAGESLQVLAPSANDVQLTPPPRPLRPPG